MNLNAEETINLSFTCKEKWDKMKSCGSGKFCNACSTIVHDMSKSSEEELKTLTNGLRHDVHCISVKAHQLDNPFGDFRDRLIRIRKNIKAKTGFMKGTSLALLTLALFLSGCFRRVAGCPAYASSKTGHPHKAIHKTEKVSRKIQS